jgi:hypothetical protein
MMAEEMQGNGELKGMKRIILIAPLEEPIEFRVLPDDPEGHPGKMIMGAIYKGHMIARKAMDMPPKIVEDQIRLRGFSRIPDVRPLMYIGIEREPKGRLEAVISIPSRPTSFDDIPDSGIDPSKLGPMTNLGMVVRLAEDRVSPEDLLKECCDHLDHILEGVAVPEVDRVIHHMRRDPVVPVGPLMCVHNVPWRTCGICRS